MNLKLAATTAALTLCGAALAADRASTSSSTSTRSSTTSERTMSANTGGGSMIERNGIAIPNDEKAFLERIHLANQSEIRAGELAESQSDSDQVKSYAREMVKDHQAADQKVMSYAQKKNLSLGDPQPTTDMERTAMDAMQARMKQLEQSRGEAFDSTYLANQLAAHDHVIAKIRLGSDAFKGELSTLLRGMLPTLMKHRQHAYSLLGKINETRGTGGSGRSTSSGGSSSSMEHMTH